MCWANTRKRKATAIIWLGNMNGLIKSTISILSSPGMKSRL